MLSMTIAIIILNLSLGVSILLQARRSFDGVIFFFITLAFSMLTVANYLSLTTELTKALFWIRIEMFLAAWHTFLFLIFVHAFTKNGFPYTLKRIVAFATPFLIILMISLSPYLFSDVLLNDRGLVETTPGALFPVYAIWLLGTMILSMRAVILNFRKSAGTTREQWRYMLVGSFTTYLALIIFNFVFAGLLKNTIFLEYTPVYSLPIVFATAYAIIKHNLFNIKVLATQAFVTIISVFYFAKVMIATNTTDRIVDGAIFVSTVLFGVLLVRSVKEEVRQREEIAALAKRLTDTNWQLGQSNERLRIMDQRKSEFVSIASHQLRTPVTAIKGYASLLLEDSYGTLSEKMKDPIGKIFHSSERLVDMINDFLNVSKIEQGTMTYTFVPTDLRKMVTDIVQDFHVAAGERKIDLKSEIPTDGRYNVTADEGKIRQIISNLIDNAIKYTPKGSVRVSLKKDPSHGEHGTIILEIKDTGIGLSQDDIHHLFGKFTRGAEGSKVNTTGSGLGLYVAKKMMEEHKGNIWVDSEGKGLGSVFCIELPEYPNDLPKTP